MGKIFRTSHAVGATGLVFALLFGASSLVAQTAAPATGAQPTAANTQRAPVPDGAPTIAKDLTINQSTLARDARTVAEAGTTPAPQEEKIENRLAVIRSGGYVVTDPNVGRYDRATGNGVKRVSPSMWELLRF